MKRFVVAVCAVVAVAGVAGCGSAPHPSVKACEAQIVARPVNGPWPMCKGLTAAQLAKATDEAMAQGATG